MRSFLAGFFCLIALSAAHRTAAWQLYLIRPDGTGLRAITAGEGQGYGSPDWAPDGQRIAFDTWPEGGGPPTSKIAVLDVPEPGATGEVTPLGHGAMPSWSPDGTQLVCHTYAVNNPGGKPQIVIVNADGSGREPILDQWGSPRWNPDGRRIISIRNRGGLVAYDVATGQQQMLFQGHPVELGFSISPDGARYAFNASGFGLGIATEEPGGAGVSITFHHLRPKVRHTSWSPDGERIVAMSTAGNGEFAARLFLLEADINGAITPLPGIPEDWDCKDPDWSPDGEWIVFSAHRRVERVEDFTRTPAAAIIINPE